MGRPDLTEAEFFEFLKAVFEYDERRNEICDQVKSSIVSVMPGYDETPDGPLSDTWCNVPLDLRVGARNLDYDAEFGTGWSMTMT